MPIVITCWLKDSNGEKVAPKTLASQVQMSDGTLLEDKINNHNHDEKYELKGAAANALTEATSYTDVKIEELSEGFSSVIYQMYGDDIGDEGAPTIREIAKDEADTAFNNVKDLIFNIDYDNLLAFDTNEIVFNSELTASAILGKAVIGRMILF